MNAIIPFRTQTLGGYDQTQVDDYFEKLTDEYNKLQTLYTDLNDRYDRLTKQQPTANMQAISKALVDAEVKAMQIVEDAENKAMQIMENTKNETTRLTGKAYMELGQIRQEKERVTGEINEIMDRLNAVLPAKGYETS